MSKFGRACTVCQNKNRAQIELGIVHGVSARVLADRFDLGRDAIYRHAKGHLSPAQRAALLAHAKPQPIDLDALKVAESEGLLSQIVHQRARLQQRAEMCAEFGDLAGAIRAEGAITANLTLAARVLGQLINVHDVRHTNILVSPDYLRLRETLLAALRPYPEAARAVVAGREKIKR
jgi:hypothetical protein